MADRDRAVEVRTPALGAGEEPRTRNCGEGRAHGVVHASSQARDGSGVSVTRQPEESSSGSAAGDDVQEGAERAVRVGHAEPLLDLQQDVQLGALRAGWSTGTSSLATRMPYHSETSRPAASQSCVSEARVSARASTPISLW